MNHVTLMGRFVADPALSATVAGKQLCRFVLAVARPHKKDGVDFVDLVAWGNTGLFVSKHFKKGQRIAVSGYITIHKYMDKENNKRKLAEIVVEKAYFADAAINTTQTNDPETSHSYEYEEYDDSDPVWNEPYEKRRISCEN